MFSMGRILGLVVAAVFGGLLVVLFARGPTPAEPAPAELATADRALGAATLATPAAFLNQNDLVEVGEMPAAERIRLGGTVEPYRMIRLNAQAPGRVTFVAGQEGERVAAGQIVVALDDAALQAQYSAAWADLSGQMAGIENAQTQLYHQLYGPSTAPMGGAPYAAYEKMTTPAYNMAQSFMGQLLPGMSGSNGPFGGWPMQTQDQAAHDYAAVSAARFAYENQLVALAASQARIDLLDAQLRDRRSVAPWAGAIMARHVRDGDIVQPGQPLADIADVDQLMIRIDVPVALVVNLHLGDAVPVTMNNTNLWAPVAQIFPGADAGAHTVTVKLALPARHAGGPRHVCAGLDRPARRRQPHPTGPRHSHLGHHPSGQPAHGLCGDTRRHGRDARAAPWRHSGPEHRRPVRACSGRNGGGSAHARHEIGRRPWAENRGRCR